ncbi:MAG: hypothetical protein ABR968_15025 [Bacteroidales bacterium]|jgi:hypothetical protein
MKTENEMKVDFGTIGLAIGDEIIFRDGKTRAEVCSSGGGTLVSFTGFEELNEYGADSCSLFILTRGIMKQPIENNIKDIFSMWFFKGKSLLEMYNERINK